MSMYKFNKDFIKTHTLAECLEEYDCSYQSLRFFCITRNVFYIKNRRTKQKQYHEKMCQYAGKMSDREASEILGCSRISVFYYRLEHHIEPFRKHKKLDNNNIDELVHEYHELGSLQAVANNHGVTRECVRQWFDKAGYKYVKNMGYVKK